MQKIVDLGVPACNIKIHPSCQIGSIHESFRRDNWGFKVLGAFIGTDEYVKRSLNKKVRSLDSTVETLLQFPYAQGRYYLHRFCFNEKIGYWLRAQFPDHTKNLLQDFRSQQTRLIASYHGLYNEMDCRLRVRELQELYV